MRHAADGDAYALTRLHAHYARLLTADQWQRLIRVGHFAAFVEQVRETVLRDWVAHLDPQVGAHRIEAVLRDRYLHENQQVAAWLPTWRRPPVDWLRQLPLLAVLRHQAAGGQPYVWLPATDRAALPPAVDGAALMELWLSRWRERWPARLTADEREALRATQRRWTSLLWSLRDDRDAGDEAPALLLERELRREFRRQRSALAGAVVYLGLLWLQTARLRGALLRRRLFPAGVMVPA